MDTTLVSRVRRYGTPWLRYMLTLSEAARTGEGWVVATGEDIGLWDTDSGPVLALWPDRSLAAEAVSDAHGNAAPLGLPELKDRLLPFLIDADASISLFPNFDDDMLVEPTAVAEDLEDFTGDSVDIAAELVGEVSERAYDEWALLESVDVDEFDEVEAGGSAGGEARELRATGLARYDDAVGAFVRERGLWLLEDPDEGAVVGVVLDDRPALALFASQHDAEAFGASVDADATPRLVSPGDLVRGWLLVAYGGHWLVALSPDGKSAAFVEPTRFALDLAEAYAG
jgi:hypothetical protein